MQTDATLTFGKNILREFVFELRFRNVKSASKGSYLRAVWLKKREFED